MARSATAADSVLDRYTERSSRSRELFERATASLAGGTTRANVYYPPYPLAMDYGDGCRLTDVDGVARLDFISNYTALIHGHAFRPVREAVAYQMGRGSAFAAPTELEARYAALLQNRIPSLERLRFCSSGTEATLFAVRLARGFTRRNRILKFEGCFHGSHDTAQISITPPLDEAGSADAPSSVPNCVGLPEDTADNVLVAPFNNAEATAAIMHRHGADIAGVIIDPLMTSGGLIPAEPAFLQALRELCDENGSLLIFDEIMSFRVAPGGYQELAGVRPDLTTLGKIISGGLPIAVFGGREDVMSLTDPRPGNPPIFQSGTYNGCAVAVAAGYAAMEALTPETLNRLNALGGPLRAGIARAFGDAGLAGQATGCGSLFYLHFTAQPLHNYRDAVRDDAERRHRLFHALLNEDIFLTPRGFGCLSTPMGPAEVDEFLAAFRRALDAVSADGA